MTTQAAIAPMQSMKQYAKPLDALRVKRGGA